MPCSLADRIDRQRQDAKFNWDRDLVHHYLPPELSDLARSWQRQALDERRAVERGGAFASFIYAWITLNAWAVNATRLDKDWMWQARVAGDEALGEMFAHWFAPGDEEGASVARFERQWPILHAFETRQVLDREQISIQGWVERFRQGDRRLWWERFRVLTEHEDAKKVSFAPSCAWEHISRDERIPTDLAHTIPALARVRNNLFHGEKGARDPLDIQIVSSAADVLLPLVRHLVR